MCFMATKRAETYRSPPNDQPIMTYTESSCSRNSVLSSDRSMLVRARAVHGQRYLSAQGLLPIDICVFILFLRK
jgi:hypothetical protein